MGSEESRGENKRVRGDPEKLPLYLSLVSLDSSSEAKCFLAPKLIYFYLEIVYFIKENKTLLLRMQNMSHIISKIFGLTIRTHFLSFFAI